MNFPKALNYNDKSIFVQVENYAVLPTQRDKWPELQLVEAYRTIEMENDFDLFKPWEESTETETFQKSLPK